MSRLISFLSLLCMLAAAGPAYAKGNHGGDKAGTPDGAGKKSLDEACSTDDSNNPLLSPTVPLLLPSSPSDFRNNNRQIAEEDVSSLRFPACSAAVADVQKSCDTAMSRILKDYRDSVKEYRTSQKKICADLKDSVANCNGQEDLEACVAKANKAAGAAFGTLSDHLNARAKELNSNADKLEGNAKALSKSLAGAASPAPAAVPTANPSITSFVAGATPNGISPATNAQNYLQDTSQTKLFKLSRTGEPVACIKNVRNANFCSTIMGADESRYYAKMLSDSGAKVGDTATKLNAVGDKTENTASGLGDGNSDDKTKDKKSGLLGGMNLDTLANLAKVAAAGGALYCAATKACSPQSSSATDTNSDISTAQSAPGATADSGPKVSSLGSLTPGTAAPSSTGASTGSSQPSQGGSSEHGSASSDSALAHFNGNLGSGATPASATAGGGSGGTGLSASASPTGSSTSTDTSRAPASANGELGIAGGGGLAAPSFGASASSGFNLGDSKSPTDNALKNILNGDTPPPGDLGGLGGLGASAAAAASDAAQDPESLFLRVKDAHVRCLKRGCVGMEVGNNI